MNVLIIEKDGNITETKIKNDNIETIYKKLLFKNDKNFKVRTEWNVKINKKKYNILLYAKNDGRANSENKYDFPPPVDSELYFGNCMLLNYENNELSDLTKEEWLCVYEKLFGGFENLNDTLEEDEKEEDELDDISDEMKTKDGYLKDGFVVDDSNDEYSDEDYQSELSEEPYIYSDED